MGRWITDARADQGPPDGHPHPPPHWTDRVQEIQPSLMENTQTFYAQQAFIWTNIQDAPWNAVGDGITNDHGAFEDFREYSVDFDVIGLLMPAGDYHVENTPSTDLFIMLSTYGIGTGLGPWEICPEIYVSAYNATLDTFPLWIGGFCLGNDQYFIETATAGSTTVTLINPADAILLKTDTNGSTNPGTQYCMLAALELQAPTQPPNNYYSEFRRILDIDTTTGVVTLDSPITNTYKSTYPQIDTFNTGIDGPATIYKVDTRWDSEITVSGLETTDQTLQIYSDNRILRFIDCTFNSAMIPGQTGLFYARNTVLGVHRQVEVDKAVDRIELYDCTADSIIFQSGSVQSVLIEDCEFTSSLIGTPREIIIRRTTSPYFAFGCRGYGRTESVTLEDCVFTSIEHNRITNPLSDFTFPGSGVIKRVGASPGNPITWAVPGATVLRFTGSAGEHVFGPPCTILDVTQSGTDIVVTTTLPDTFPTITGAITPTHIGILGVGELSVSGCSGGFVALELSEAAAVGKPLGAYAKRTLTASAAGTLTGIQLWGRLVSFSVNVTTPYTGAQATCVLKADAPSGAPYINSSNAYAQWNVTINLKIAGNRVITPSGVTGAQSGDSISSITADAWFIDGFFPFLDTDVSGDTPEQKAVFTIEVVMDQSE